MLKILCQKSHFVKYSENVTPISLWNLNSVLSNRLFRYEWYKYFYLFDLNEEEEKNWISFLVRMLSKNVNKRYAWFGGCECTEIFGEQIP